MRRTTRREMLALGGAAAVAGLTSGAGAQTLQQLLQRGVLGAGEGRPIRIAVVVPAKTGLSTVATSINDYVGEAGRMGALVAEVMVGEELRDSGWRLDLLHANTPSAASAERATRRLVETGDVAAIIGGIGAGQAEAMAKICERAAVPFFNIGESADALRGAGCGRYVFHIEASAAMYLDAMAALGAAQGRRRWHIVYEDSAFGRILQARAAKAIAKQGGASAQLVGNTAVKREAPVYFNQFNAIRQSNADVIMLLTYAVDQIAFLAQQENANLMTPTITFPDPITQTRDYIASIRELAPMFNPRTRVAPWETTLTAHGAEPFNKRYMTRWAEPVDPTGWGAYAAIKMIAQALRDTRAVTNADLVRYFERQDVTFDVGKGPGVNFRPWDHQLRQPMYAVDIDQQSEWVRIDFNTWVALGKTAGEIAPTGASQNLTQRLDQFGDSPTDSACRMLA
jgi:ABC-type branched-subunit amino acid transport system substrate-binding protein